MQEKGRSDRLQILCVITACGGGDWPPLLALAEGLGRCGHQLLMVCDNSTVDSVCSTGLKYLCLPQSLDFANIFEPAMARLLSGDEDINMKDENPLLTWGHASVDYVVGSLKEWRPELVITSLFGIGLGEMLAKHYLVPRCLLNPAYYFGHSGKHIWDADFSVKGGQMYRNWLLPLAITSNLILHATDKGFDFVTTVLPPLHKYVGPLFWEMSGKVEEMLRKGGVPWVLITLSTSPQPSDMTIVKSALIALESQDVRVLVTLAPGHDKDMLGRIPANVSVTGYIPHSQVLPLCHLVICHAGHGIVMKAMAHGVPMVLVPWGRDQPGVARRAKRLGLATVVPKDSCTVEALSAAIRMVLDEPGYQERSKKISSRLSGVDGVANGVEQIERFMGKR